MRELEKKERMNYYDEEITQKLIQAQIELANSKMTSNLDALGPAKNEFKRSSDDPKILLKVNLKSTTSVVQSNALQSIKPAHESSKPAETSKLLKKAPKDPLEELRETEIKKRLRVTRENWLFPDIVVKVMHAELENGKYYKHKGVVLKVHEKFIGEVRMLDSGDLLRLDQDDLETVIPRIGGKVLIVNTAFAGATGALVAINSETFTALIRIDKGINKDTEIWLPYEHFSKLTVQ
ncbi:DNA/RNA-binding protein KIN17-like [Zophobas morio]|uniref:DNA/RNA-binding protein KIN17-like n=1 Tax=Zophobas morio TaxID=2755281 RepID=UPI003083554D